MTEFGAQATLADDGSVSEFIDAIHFDERGLAPAIAQQHDTGEVLMLAWVSNESLHETFATGQATYWSRSRKKLWRKGEESGHVQRVLRVSYDCDADTILFRVDQHGPACHTGTRTCFLAGETLEVGATARSIALAQSHVVVGAVPEEEVEFDPAHRDHAHPHAEVQHPLEFITDRDAAPTDDDEAPSV